MYTTVLKINELQRMCHKVGSAKVARTLMYDFYIIAM